MDGVIPALADLSFPRSAAPWLTGFTLQEDGVGLDTSGMTARFDLAPDATFSAPYFTITTAAPSANGSTLVLDSTGDGELSISLADANFVPTNGVESVAAPYRLVLIQGGVPTPVVVGTLYADPF